MFYPAPLQIHVGGEMFLLTHQLFDAIAKCLILYTICLQSEILSQNSAKGKFVDVTKGS